MGKISHDDKLRMQTLREQGLGAKAIVAKYLHKGRKLCCVPLGSESRKYEVVNSTFRLFEYVSHNRKNGFHDISVVFMFTIDLIWRTNVLFC